MSLGLAQEVDVGAVFGGSGRWPHHDRPYKHIGRAIAVGLDVMVDEIGGGIDVVIANDADLAFAQLERVTSAADGSQLVIFQAAMPASPDFADQKFRLAERQQLLGKAVRDRPCSKVTASFQPANCQGQHAQLGFWWTALVLREIFGGAVPGAFASHLKDELRHHLQRLNIEGTHIHRSNGAVFPAGQALFDTFFRTNEGDLID